MDPITERAAAIAREHGKAAASWVFDGNTTEDTYRAVLAGIESGDPAVMDAYRTPDLSGEFAGDYTPRDLAADLGIAGDADPEESGLSDAETTYLDTASEAFWHEVERMARAHLPACATVGCHGTATERITYRYRGEDQATTDDVCGDCADSYSRRPVLVDFERSPIA